VAEDEEDEEDEEEDGKVLLSGGRGNLMGEGRTSGESGGREIGALASGVKADAMLGNRGAGVCRMGRGDA
jgi:hypothetical protein